MSLYEINLQREILREKGAEILADFNRYMEKNSIDSKDNKNPIVLLYLNTIEIYNNIFSSKYDNMIKIEIANGQLDLAWNIIKNSNNTLYEINLQREILREKSAEILADYRRCFKKYGKNNKILENLYNSVEHIHTNIFDSEYNSIEKLNTANGKLDLAWDIIKNLDN